MPIRNYPTCHCHPQSLDSASTPEAFVKRELELGTGVITVTDHGSLAACRTVYDLAKKNKLIPVLGIEAYFRDDNCPILTAAGIQKNAKGTYADYVKYHHVTIHFLDQAAYECGVRLISKAPIERHGQETKPLFNWANLEELAGHNVTMTTGCLIGMVQRHLLDHNDPQMALRYFERMQAIVGRERLYVEVFPHVCDRNWVKGIFVTVNEGDNLTKIKFHDGKKLKTNIGEISAEELAKAFLRKKCDHHTLNAVKDYQVWNERNPVQIIGVEKVEDFIVNECRPWAPDGDVQKGCNEFVMRMAAKYKAPILIADDSHFAHPEEKPVQDVRLMASGGSWRFYNSYHRQSSEESFAYFKNKLHVSEKTFEGWVDNAYGWADRFKNFKFVTAPSLPTKFYPDDTLRHTLDLIKKHGRMDWKNKAYVDRLGQEIELLYRNGTIDLLPYFQVGEEVCWMYTQNGLLTGPGRGSAAGLLLTYLLGITHADPLRYNLSLERFITKDRIASGALPDIDQDLAERDTLIPWLDQRFGDHYAQISVDTTLKLKSAIKDVCRVLVGHVLPEVDALTRKLPEPPQGVSDHNFVFGYTDSDNWHPGVVDTDPILRSYIAQYPSHWAIVSKALGLGRQKSRHACFPATESFYTRQNGIKKITDCEGEYVYTGQGKYKKGIFSENGRATLLEQGEREVFEYTLANGRVIRCTPDHMVLTTEGWMPIQSVFEQGVELAKTSTRIRLTKEDAEIYAINRGGNLIEWGGNATNKSIWKCNSGHEWKGSFTRLFSYEHWCKVCSHKNRFSPTKRYVSPERSASKCLNTYRRYDAKKGFQTDITVEDVMLAKASVCIYCTRMATGMERIKNTIGHTRDNCVPACLRCNWMRGRYVSHEVMLEVGKVLMRVDP